MAVLDFVLVTEIFIKTSERKLGHTPKVPTICWYYFLSVLICPMHMRIPEIRTLYRVGAEQHSTNTNAFGHPIKNALMPEYGHEHEQTEHVP